MKKRFFALLLVLALSISTVACSSFSNQSQNNPDSPKQSDNNSDDDSNETSNGNESVDTSGTGNDYTTDSWVNPGSLTSVHAIVNAAAKASPSVVAITTEVVSYGGYYGNYVSEGAGSGVIYSEDGYIITNNHVIDGASTVRVTLVNGDTYDATVIGADSITDIAVLKIDATGLLAANPSQNPLSVGEPVIAIGNPLGTLSGTVTTGIVSALSRTIMVEGVAMELLQFDAAVSPGNSGGGLFDINGNLIAVVNAKSSGEGIEGISFAIPVSRALDITKQFIEQGYISGRPGLGTENECITSTNYESYQDSALWEYATIGNRVYPGLYITNTANVDYADSDETFHFGDRIIQIENTEITSESDLAAALSTHEIGDIITVRVYRKTQTTSSFGGSGYTYTAVDITIRLVEHQPTASTQTPPFGGGTNI